MRGALCKQGVVLSGLSEFILQSWSLVGCEKMSLRIKAFLWHLAASALVAVLTLFLVFFVWYPSPLHEAVGVTYIFLVLLGVDVTLGPLLTLLVFKAGKKTLLFDMVVIVLLQLGALGYGLATVAEGRPAWLVFNVDRFDLVRVLDIDQRGIDEALPWYRHPGWLGPQWVGAVAPDTAEKRNALLFEALEGGSDLAQRPYLYHPLSEMKEQLRERARPLAELEAFNPPEAVKPVLEGWPLVNAWVPLMASVKPMVVLLDREKAEVISVVDLRPWKD